MSTSRLLVIDHDSAVQQAVESALNPEGFDVTAVADGLSALDLALASPPDVILAEYRMEGVNVFRFIEKLKHKSALNGVALLLLVNPADTYDELTLRLVGVTEFLRKPLNPKELLDRVKRYRPFAIPVPAAPAAMNTVHSEPQPVEDLLGWSQDASPSPFSELSQDQSTGLDFGLAPPDQSASAAGSADATEFLERNEVTPSEHPAAVSDTEQAFADLAQGALAAPEPAFADPTDSLFPQAESPRPASAPVPDTAHRPAEHTGNGSLPVQPEVIERLAHDVAQQAVERVAWDVVPDLAKQSLERIVTAVVERVVWDVVPAIAEAAVKQEIERLTRDNG
ncbi:MAG: response regulator [Nitrospirota bacterium]